jgi:hypothetical protein
MAVLKYYYKVTPSNPTVEFDVSVTATTAMIKGVSVDIALDYQYNKTDGVLGWFLSKGIGEDTLDEIGKMAGNAVTSKLRSFITGKTLPKNNLTYITICIIL